MNTTGAPAAQKPASPPRYSRLQVGKEGERAAAVFLLANGYEILEMNWRSGAAGEIDIVAGKQHVVVFVEVKTRRLQSAADALAAVDPKKLRRMLHLGTTWMRINGDHRPYRFDVIGVQLRDDQEPLFEWLRDVAG